MGIGFEIDIENPCLFTCRKFGTVTIVIVYVDDMIPMSSDYGKDKIQTSGCVQNENVRRAKDFT